MIQQVYKELESLYSPREARAIARLVFEQEFGVTYTELLCNGDNCLSEQQKCRLHEIVARLLKGEPIQYILGKAEFCGRMFKVTPATLIPRPETEQLINATSSGTGNLVLDIGTGSGCIAITIALDHPDWQVEAWDISAEALKVAQENADTLGARNITFRQVDILNKENIGSIKGNHDFSLFSFHFSLIVSNPPYVCEKEKSEMEPHVLDYEPSSALFVPDNDPLLFYRTITGFATKTLEPGGTLLFEINRAYGKEVAELMKNHGFTEVTIKKDQYGNDRIVQGSR